MISDGQHFLLLVTLGLDKRAKPNINHIEVGPGTTETVLNDISQLQKEGYLRFGYTENGGDYYHCTSRGKAAAKLNYDELAALLNGDEGESD